jgi:hypothetical protein
MGLPFFLSRNSTVEAIIIPLHLLALCCIFYIFYFDSKSLLIAEGTGDYNKRLHAIAASALLFPYFRLADSAKNKSTLHAESCLTSFANLVVPNPEIVHVGTGSHLT